jgi:hypothetical protein
MQPGMRISGSRPLQRLAARPWASFAALFGIGATNDTLAKRLARILGMLGSDHDGEILAAARAATALVTRSGLTWSAVLGVDDADAPGGVAD